jgi:16S rRNA (guanine1207-N2)-methyltransferase
MSRWGRDPEAAADELIGRCVAAIGLDGPVLVANHVGRLPALLAERGILVTQWHRRLVVGGPAAQAWPPPGPFKVAMLRLPKAKDEQEMAAHACLGTLREGGRLIVYGGNDEGIRSAAGLLARLAGEVETLAARGHGRVLAVRRPADIAELRTSLSAWRIAAPLEIAGIAHDWVTYPGVFSAGRVDEGTSLLLDALPLLHAGSRVLDYGCGSGVIGAAALARQPGIALDLLDSDAVALEAVRENVPGARLALAASLAAASGTWDAILSNPPLHAGFAEDHALLEGLIADAPRRLRPDGCLAIVVQRRVPLDRLLARHFARIAVAAETSRYRVWHGAHPLSPLAGRGEQPTASSPRRLATRG